MSRLSTLYLLLALLASVALLEYCAQFGSQSQSRASFATPDASCMYPSHLRELTVSFEDTTCVLR